MSVFNSIFPLLIKLISNRMIVYNEHKCSEYLLKNHSVTWLYQEGPLLNLIKRFVKSSSRCNKSPSGYASTQWVTQPVILLSLFSSHHL